MDISEITSRASATLSYLVSAQEMIAVNIANNNQKNYAAKNVDFQMFLESLDSQPEINASSVTVALDNAIVVESAPDASLDNQIAQLEQVSMRYDTLIEVLGRHMSLYSIAANRGR